MQYPLCQMIECYYLALLIRRLYINQLATGTCLYIMQLISGSLFIKHLLKMLCRDHNFVGSESFKARNLSCKKRLGLVHTYVHPST